MKLFIGASSNEKLEDKYIDDCRELLEIILKDNDLVFGAYNKGLMGLAYDIAKKNKRTVTGICPKIYETSLEPLECDSVLVTDSIIDATLKLYENSDIIIMLPGAFGSLFEFFTANYYEICKEMDKQIILYNSCGFYDKLIEFINDLYDKKLIRDSEMGHFIIMNNKVELIEYLKKYN